MNNNELLSSQNIDDILFKYAKYRAYGDIADRVADNFVPSLEKENLKYEIELKKRALGKDDSPSVMRTIGIIGLSALAGGAFAKLSKGKSLKAIFKEATLVSPPADGAVAAFNKVG